MNPLVPAAYALVPSAEQARPVMLKELPRLVEAHDEPESVEKLIKPKPPPTYKTDPSVDDAMLYDCDKLFVRHVTPPSADNTNG